MISSFMDLLSGAMKSTWVGKSAPNIFICQNGWCTKEWSKCILDRLDYSRAVGPNGRKEEVDDETEVHSEFKQSRRKMHIQENRGFHIFRQIYLTLHATKHQIFQRCFIPSRPMHSIHSVAGISPIIWDLKQIEKSKGMGIFHWQNKRNAE